jgi:hypothetical protein
MKINALAAECAWKYARMKYLKSMLLMPSLKIVMRAWNAGRAALTARLTQFQWRQALAVQLQ